ARSASWWHARLGRLHVHVGHDRDVHHHRDRRRYDHHRAVAAASRVAGRTMREGLKPLPRRLSASGSAGLQSVLLYNHVVLPPLFLEATCFLLGLVIGSFLNVVIARLPEGRSIVRPPSACPACSGSIRWYDNIPVLSWLWLRARCRNCQASISWRYPLVELLTAVLFLLAARRFGPTLELGAALLLLAAL